ncbi:SurA N-terminal domain-containing protein [Candidatus Saccharibacteria bacterium]|nr:SurA N-terminal domain-containing protein [Candidatus Saccharibacteria bacterium]
MKDSKETKNMNKNKKSLKEKLPKFNKSKERMTEKEKFEERREEILAHGRKFKYPMQFAKHRLVFITIAIAIIAVIAAGAFGWFALYKSRSTSDVLYRLTMVLPVPVAKIDGENVRYSDYLMIYKSSITPVIQQNGDFSTGKDDADDIENAYKRFALDAAEDYTYAIKLARQLGIDITEEMIDKSFDEHRKVGGTDRSRENFLKVLKDNFDLTESEYRRMLYLSLAKSEVARKIDTEANKKAEEAYKKVVSGGDFRKVAEELNIEYEETGGLIDVMNVDGGRSNVAYELKPGQISEVFTSLGGDAYYIVKLVEKTDSRVNYVSLKIPFTEFNNRLANVREENRVEEYIEIPGTESENEEMLKEANR